MLNDVRGWTPLHYAAYQDDPVLCELLLYRGGSVLATTLSGENQTPLEVARQYNPDKPPNVTTVLEKALQTQAEKANKKKLVMI